jgi:hypothetical protein
MAGLLGELRVFWTGGRRIERTAYLIGAVLLLSGLAHLGVQAVLGGPWLGPVSWRKPTTFGLSFGLTLISVTWAASFLRIGDRARAALLGTLTAASIGEVALITLQAWRRVPSHFNLETPFDVGVTTALAAGGVTLVALVFALFGLSLRRQPGLDPLLRTGVRAGFGALVVAMLAGVVMIAIGSALARGGQQQLAYHAAGGFKPAHAVAMHGVLLLPGMAWLAGLGGLPEARGRRLWSVAALGYGGLLACSFAPGPGWVWAVGGGFALVLLAAALPLLIAALTRRPSTVPGRASSA